MIIHHFCPQFKSIHGGGEPVICNLVNTLAGMGHTNYLYSIHIPPAAAKTFDTRIRILQFPDWLIRIFQHPLILGLMDFFMAPVLILPILFKQGILCFYTENTVPAMFVYSLLSNKPYIYFCFQPPRFAYDISLSEVSSKTVSWLKYIFSPFSFLYRTFDKLAAARAPKILTFSNGYKKWIESIYSATNVSVIQPGVQIPETCAPLPHNISSRLTEESKTLIFSGKFIPKKNLGRLITIVKLLKPAIPHIRLLLLGDGPDRPWLEKLVCSAGLEDNVIFCGFIRSHKDVFSYLKKAHLAVLLEKNISFGLSIIEANACGVPCLAFEGGGPSDIITPGQNGFLIPENSTDEAIASVILDYFSNSSMVEQMKNKSLSASKNYTWDSFALQYVECLSSLKPEQ